LFLKGEVNFRRKKMENIEKKEINGKMRTVITTEIDWEGKKEKVEILKLTFGEDLSVRNKYTKVNVVAGKPEVTVNQEGITIDSLTKAICKAPFAATEQNIRDLDKDVATQILEAYSLVNNPSEKKNLN
jgi:hypothetical protein